MNTELIRIVDSISRDKNIDKDSVLLDLEQAMVSAVRKAYGQMDDVQVSIDRLTGDITAQRNGEPIEMRELGRIAAQTAKQVMIQKIREAERGSIFEEFSERKGAVITGNISRYEGGALLVNLGRAEGFLPKSEQIPGETQHPGERIRCMILDVREAPRQVKIVLSRSHPDFIRRLFELEVPEVAERIIEIKALAREAGYRTKIAVSSIDSKVDAVGACVGVRGSRIKNIVFELGGEKIDIVRWNESSQILIGNALKPAEVAETALCFELNRATVVVPEDQLSLAIGKRGQNVRLAARLTGWDIDILTPAEYNKNLDDLETEMSKLEFVDSEKIEKMMAMGIVSVADIEEVGSESITNVLGLTEEQVGQVITTASEAAKRIAEAKAAEAAAKASAEATEVKADVAETAAESDVAETADESVTEPDETQPSDSVPSDSVPSDLITSDSIVSENATAPETSITPEATPEEITVAPQAETGESVEDPEKGTDA